MNISVPKKKCAKISNSYLLFLELGFILYVLFMLKFNFPQTIDTTKLSFLRLRLQHVSQQTQGLVTIIFTKKPQGRNLKCQISIQHFFKIVLYWCLDLIRHNIDTHLKYNKYIFDISIPFCHHFYLSATLKQCFTEFAVSSNVHSSQLRLIPYLHHTSSVLR